MLKIRLAALTALLLVSFAPSGIAQQQKTIIGVSLAQDDNPFYIAMLRGIRARAQELGWEVATVSANEDKLKQINGVQDLVARGVNGILISPIDAVGVNAAYDASAAAKIPIVSVARGSTSPNQTIHVAMDEKQIGRDIAEWTAKKLGGKGKVARLMGPSGAPTFTNRLLSSMFSGSSPDRRHLATAAGRWRGLRPRTPAAISRMCSGVVPQQPPTMLTSPDSPNSRRISAVSAAPSSYSPKALGRPAFG